jgi:hypothetical protein
VIFLCISTPAKTNLVKPLKFLAAIRMSSNAMLFQVHWYLIGILHTIDYDLFVNLGGITSIEIEG